MQGVDDTRHPPLQLFTRDPDPAVHTVGPKVLRLIRSIEKEAPALSCLFFFCQVLWVYGNGYDAMYQNSDTLDHRT